MFRNNELLICSKKIKRTSLFGKASFSASFHTCFRSGRPSILYRACCRLFLRIRAKDNLFFALQIDYQESEREARLKRDEIKPVNEL